MSDKKAFSATLSAFMAKFLPSTSPEENCNVFDEITNSTSEKAMCTELVRSYGSGVCGWH